jgi:hypothetical protein
MAGKPLTGDMNEPAPQVFAQPTEALDPLPPVRNSPELSALHSRWAQLHTSTPTTPSIVQRARRKIRRVLNRVMGGADHETEGEMIRALDALASRLDTVADRLARQDAVTAEVAAVLGQELSRLRSMIGSDPSVAASRTNDD